jgi:hypothetical protein
MQNKILFLFLIFLYLTNSLINNNYKTNLNKSYFLSNNTIRHSNINIKYCNNNKIDLNKLSFLLKKNLLNNNSNSNIIIKY